KTGNSIPHTRTSTKNEVNMIKDAVQRVRLHNFLLIALAGLALSACGGGGSDNSSQPRSIDLQGAGSTAHLDSATDAAHAAMAVANIVLPAASLASGFGSSATSVPAGKSAPCPGGGSIKGESGGTVKAQNCRINGGLLDGVFNLHCAGVDPNGNYCLSSKPHYGSDNGTPVLFKNNLAVYNGPVGLMLKGGASQQVSLINGDLSHLQATLNMALGLQVDSSGTSASLKATG